MTNPKPMSNKAVKKYITWANALTLGTVSAVVVGDAVADLCSPEAQRSSIGLTSGPPTQDSIFYDKSDANLAGAGFGIMSGFITGYMGYKFTKFVVGKLSKAPKTELAPIMDEFAESFEPSCEPEAPLELATQSVPKPQ